MDNRLFNINGRSEYQFKLALQALLTDEYKTEDVDSYDRTWGVIGTGVRGYKFTYDKGLILYWYINKEDVLPIDNILEGIDFPKNLLKSVRKYKLDSLDEEIKKQVTIPLDILTFALWNWLENFNEIEKMKFKRWEDNADHDGSNEIGFRIYTEEWGHIKINKHSIDHYTIGAIKPVYLWYGK